MIASISSSESGSGMNSSSTSSSVLLRRLLLAPAGAECLGRLDPPLPLALEHLELLVLVQRPLQLLLGGAQARRIEAQGVAPLGVALAHRVASGPPRCGTIRLIAQAPSPAAQDVPVQVEDGLPAAGADVDDDAVVLEARPRAPSRRRTRAFAAPRPAGTRAISRNVSMCRSGMTSRCVSACGLMSRIATKPSAARTWSPSRTSLQKRQSSGTASDPLLGDAPRRARARARRPARRTSHGE